MTTKPTNPKTEICDAIHARKRFLITSHARPDGDSIGSQLAMAYALEALGKEIEKRGHDFLIAEREFRRGNRAIPDEASIKIDIYLADEKSRTKINADRRPGLSFVTKHKTQMVQVLISDITSRGGSDSKIGEFPLEKVDTAFVRDKFIALFKRLVSK